MRFFVSILAVAAVLSLPACSSDPATLAKQQAVGKVLLADGVKVLGSFAVSTLENIATQEMNGGNVDFGHAAAAGGYSIAQRGVTSGDIQDVINAWSGGTMPATATVAAATFQTAVDRGVAPPQAANAVANVISAAATHLTVDKPSVTASVAQGLVRLAATPPTIVPLEKQLFPNSL